MDGEHVLVWRGGCMRVVVDHKGCWDTHCSPGAAKSVLSCVYAGGQARRYLNMECAEFLRKSSFKGGRPDPASRASLKYGGARWMLTRRKTFIALYILLYINKN